MTELENRLLQLIQTIEGGYRARDQELATTLADLSNRLSASAAQVTALSAQVDVLARHIERLHSILNAR